MRRRSLLQIAIGSLPTACAAPFAPSRGDTAQGASLLQQSAVAHGTAAFDTVHDISVRYAGQWHDIVGSLQPALVDQGFRGKSEERLLPQAGLYAQAYTGPAGTKQVVRQDAFRDGGGTVHVWFNGQEAHDRQRRDAAALVADGYALFLVGPPLLQKLWALQRSLLLDTAPAESITVGKQDYRCDVLQVVLRPGLGFSLMDELALYLDQDRHLMRRVRFTLNGLQSTRGAVAEVDLWGHFSRGAVTWPSRFHERLIRPVPLPVHDWWMEGFDLNRGLTPADMAGPAFTGPAAVPAAVPLASNPWR